jgi:molybdopterin-guanine dinucleotide biosynthesis protein A
MSIYTEARFPARRTFKTEKDMLISKVTGVVLLGGMSRRFGSNKSFAMVDGVPLIERVTRIMRSIFEVVVLITNTPDIYSRLQLPMFEDHVKGVGPIGGLYSALLNIPSDSAFVTACDMPYLNERLIRHLVEVSVGFDVTVPAPGGNIEPLHALYSKRCIPALEQCIDAGKRRIIQFYSDTTVQFVPESELRRFDPDLRSLFNINRPEDLAKDEK